MSAAETSSLRCGSPLGFSFGSAFGFSFTMGGALAGSFIGSVLAGSFIGSVLAGFFAGSVLTGGSSQMIGSLLLIGGLTAGGVMVIGDLLSAVLSGEFCVTDLRSS